jgi:uncharacterized zinc-type alcohol dehydrogenase-like protein
MKVGIIGVGGLGHLAIQFARAMGSEVTAFTSSLSKKEDALEMGATHVVQSNDTHVLRQSTRSLDFILNTATADLPWGAYLDMLRPDGKLCFVGVPPTDFEVHAFTLIAARRSICGSSIGSRREMREMLEFAAKHGIKARTEEFPMYRVNEALDHVRNNCVRYRAVLFN